MAFRFFISYAHDDTQKEDVEEFFDDLVSEVSALLDRGEGIGFLDHDTIEQSSAWGEAISDALRTCKVLVCLTSERYIGSDYCGKELEAFRARVVAEKKEKANLIIAVRWAPNLRNLPPLLEPLQYDRRGLPDLYATKGLLRLKRLRDPGYLVVVQSLADLIVERSNAEPLPEASTLPSLSDTPNAFSDPAGPAVRSTGPKNAKFVYLAASSNELRAMRNSCDAYGDNGYFWCPFCPPADETVGTTAYSVANAMKLRPDEIQPGPDLLRELQAASDSNTPVAVVVDPWSLEIKKYYDHGRSIDSFNSPTCAVFVPWNPYDVEMKEREVQLLTLVRKTFRARIATSKETYYQERVSSIAEFRDRLRDAIHQMRFQIWNDGTPSNPVNNEVKLETLSVV